MKQNRATVVKTMKPGDPGTRRQLERYGDELLFVRYRHDEAKHERLTPVEIVVDRGPRAVAVAPYQHVGLRLRGAQARRNPSRKLCWLRLAVVVHLSLEERITAWAPPRVNVSNVR